MNKTEKRKLKQKKNDILYNENASYSRNNYSCYIYVWYDCLFRLYSRP